MIMKKLIATQSPSLLRDSILGNIPDVDRYVLQLLTLGDIVHLRKASPRDRCLVDNNPIVKEMIKFLDFLHDNGVQYPKSWRKLFVADSLLASQLNAFKRAMGGDINAWRVNPMQISLPFGYSGRYILLNTLNGSDTLYGWFDMHGSRIEAAMIQLGYSVPVTVVLDPDMIVQSRSQRHRADRLDAFNGIRLTRREGLPAAGVCGLYRQTDRAGNIKEWFGVTLKEGGELAPGPIASYKERYVFGVSVELFGVTLRKGGSLVAGPCASYRLTSPDGVVRELSGITIKEFGLIAAGLCDSYKQTYPDGAVAEWRGITIKDDGLIAAGSCDSYKVTGAGGAIVERSDITIKEGGQIAAGPCRLFRLTHKDGCVEELLGITLKEDGQIAEGSCRLFRLTHKDGCVEELSGITIKEGGKVADGRCALYRRSRAGKIIIELNDILVSREDGVLLFSSPEPEDDNSGPLRKRRRLLHNPSP